MIKDKTTTREALTGLCEKSRLQGKKIGFTSGAFDLLHAGHVDYLEKAKTMCDVLIVGVNSDASVKRYKGEGRPIVGESQRIKVLAALQSVDHVFLFDERRNEKNIDCLKPDFYIKAGDYKPEDLTSKPLVESYGGEVRIIPVNEYMSTSLLLDRITQSGGTAESVVDEEGAVHFKRRPIKQSSAIFVDRDGTINEEIHYLHEPEKFKLLPNVIEGLKKFQTMGFRIIVITNQPGIGFGYYTKEDFFRVNKKMLSILSKTGILVDKIYFCPHTKAEGCDCRKPGQALIERARVEMNLDLNACVIVGDRTSDIEAGKRAGMSTVLVKSGAGGKDDAFEAKADFIAEDLLDAAHYILKNERK